MNRRKALTVAIWFVATAPTWMTLIYVGPETFWQTFTIGCAQAWTGGMAIVATMMLWEGQNCLPDVLAARRKDDEKWRDEFARRERET